jgi:hypothetical protein
MKLKSCVVVTITAIAIALTICFGIFYVEFVLPSFFPPLFYVRTDDRPTTDLRALDVNSMAVYSDSNYNMLVFVEYSDDHCFANMIPKRNEAFFRSITV